MANDEIQNKRPHNEYVESISGHTLNPSADESKLNSQMNLQYRDSVEMDKVHDHVQHGDATESLPSGHAAVSSEHEVFDGSRKGQDQGVGKVSDKQDFRKG